MKGRFFEYMRLSISGLRDLFLTRNCTACSGVLLSGEEHLCRKCLDDIPLTYTWCYSENAVMERLGSRCRTYNAASLFFYRHGAPHTRIVTDFKYNRREPLGLWAGRMLGSYLREGGLYGGVQAIVPVPLHPLRRFKRGFNQSEIIARGISQMLPGTFVAPRLLQRLRHTSTQTRKSAEERSQNISGAFRIRPREMERLRSLGVTHILVVDDVLTTGATLSECVRALQNHFTVSAATLGFVE